MSRMFSQRHYVQVAAILAKTRAMMDLRKSNGEYALNDQEILDYIQAQFVSLFGNDSSRFNAFKFLEAAGVEEAKARVQA